MIKPSGYTIDSVDNTKASISFTIQADLFYLNGHFKKQALVPGVVQIGWAVEFSKELFKINTLNSLKAVKFTSPILPNDKVDLTLTVNEEKKTLSFVYTLTDKNKVASSGTVILV